LIDVKDTGPLTWNVPIVDVRSGRPSPEFQRRWETQRRNNSLINTLTFGSGAPTGSPEDGAEYIDTSTTPYTIYFGKGGTWHQAGAVNFIDLQDAPHSYSGKANDLVAVNTGATGVTFYSVTEFLDLVLGAAQGDIIYRNAAGWVVLTPGTDGSVLTTHGPAADPTWEGSSGDLGFGFNATGLLSSGEQLGGGIIPHDVTFLSTDPSTQIIAQIPATAQADCPIFTHDSFGVLYSPGVIRFAAGSASGTLVLSPDPWLYVARKPIFLYAPSPADTTLAEIMAWINGTRS
jgi:hypothetical protein